MTIRKGGTWGAAVPRPDDLIVVHDDAALASAFARGDGPVAPTAGDVFTTLGARPLGDRTELQRLPFDLLSVSIDGGEAQPAIAHVVVRSPWWRGGRLRGALVIVMNAEHLAGLPIAPRGHPNDGRAEVFELDAGLSIRQRLAIRRRARNASHLPHPGIHTRSVRSASWRFERPNVVVVDGVRCGRARSVTVAVVPDGGVLHA